MLHGLRQSTKHLENIMRCKTCGEPMEGYGYTDVIHCPNVDVTGIGYEPDANPVYCKEEEE